MAGEVEVLRGRRRTDRSGGEGLPHDWDAEHTLVGSLLACQGDGWEELARVSPPDAFSRPGWGEVWRVIGELRAAQRPCSAPDVFEHFAAAGGLPAGIEPMMLLGAPSHAVLGELLPRYARRVAEMHARRQAIQGALAVIEMARAPMVDLGDLARAWDRHGEAIRTQGAPAREWRAMGDLAFETVEAARDRVEGRYGDAVSTGYPQLDGKLGGGLVPGDLVVVGGRPAMGKSAFALSMMLKSARLGHGWGLFSLELMNSIAARRVLAQQARLSSAMLKTGAFPDGTPMGPDQYRKALQGAEELGCLPLWVCDRPAQSLATIHSGIRRLKVLSEGRLRAVVIDYLQIMDLGGGKQSTADRIAVTAQGLRNMAKEEGIAVVVLSQLNREVDKRDGARPVLADLRDSGGIEAAATVVLFPWRESAKAGTVHKPATERAEIIIAKATDGQTGTVPFQWHAAYQEFVEAEYEAEVRAEWRGL